MYEILSSMLGKISKFLKILPLGKQGFLNYCFTVLYDLASITTMRLTISTCPSSTPSNQPNLYSGLGELLLPAHLVSHSPNHWVFVHVATAPCFIQDDS